ncbi:MAG TPA: prohibitin family protein [Chitinispirillaceae bacterium]|nr:prohibitin family protein [Chitinispirillaceae bacterium]
MTFIVAVILIFAGIVLLFSPSGKQKPGTKPLAGLVIIASIALVVYKSIVIIPAGHVGVVDFFGTVSNHTLKPGINLANPLADVIKMSIKTREVKETVTVPTQEGLSLSLEVSLLYHLNPENADEVYKTVGPVYEDVLIYPQFRSVIRTVTAGYEAKALYTSVREKLSMGISEELKKQIGPRGIIIENTPLRNIQLPAKVAEAIEEKLRAEQESQRMQYVLEKEKLEADRKRIEAQGIADFQKIVAEGLNKDLLQWKGIEATEKLAASANSKVVIVGGKDGLPLILNPDK